MQLRENSEYQLEVSRRVAKYKDALLENVKDIHKVVLHKVSDLTLYCTLCEIVVHILVTKNMNYFTQLTLVRRVP